jgi:anthranilate synthase component 2
MKVLVFDNYDSFTYNLVHLVEKIIGDKVEVHRNDKIPLEEIKKYDKIILSPGPGIPIEAGLLLPLIKEYAGSKSILGVCLGHQATPIKLSGDKNLFKGLPEELEVGRYHSWVISNEDFPEDLEITAKDANGFIMALQHKTYDVRGVQFHPESVLTPQGEVILRNWLKK